MSFSFDSLDQETARAGGAAARINIPVRVERYDVAANAVTGTRIDVDDPVAGEVTVRLLPDPLAGKRKFRRPEIRDLARRVQSGGVLRFDGALQTAPGRFESGWGVPLTRGPFDDEICHVGWCRVRPYKPPMRQTDPIRLAAEVMLPGTAYAIPAGDNAEHAVKNACRRMLEDLDSHHPWGTRCAWLMVTHQGDHRLLLVVQRFRGDSFIPLDDEPDTYLPRIWRQTFVAALDAGGRVTVCGGRVVYMGKDQITTLARANQLPDRWYMAEGANDTLFARSSIALRRRQTGSWFFTEILPLRMRPQLLAAETLIDRSVSGGAACE